MDARNKQITVEFANNHQQVDVDLEVLVGGLADFLELFGTAYLLGADFARVIGQGGGAVRLERLLAATGFAHDPYGFVRRLIGYLETANGQGPEPLRLNAVVMPQMLLVAILEKILPGNGFVSIKTVAQLEGHTNISVPEDQRDRLQQVIDTYPVRLSMHTIRQMRVSRNVAYQYLPFVQELDPVGHTNTWIGQFHQGLLEQMYQNRVIFLLNMSCPVYCRFCFRKHKASRNQANPGTDDVARAVAHVAASPGIKEIVITGGDPFLNRRNLAAAIDGLKAVDHVQTLRLATRSVAYHPHLFLAEDGELLGYLKLKNLELQRAGKRMEVATHLIHPDEVSPECLAIISELVGSGIPVYVQTPFLKDCNDQGPELTRLFGLLRGAGAELHYIYIPCSPIHGNSIYWTPLATGVNVARYLRANLSDRVMPRICTATPIGKLDWNTSGWAVAPDLKDDHFLWLRTPYTPAYFKRFAPLADGLDNLRVNAEGTIDARYMAQPGDAALFLGDRPARAAARPPLVDPPALKAFQDAALADQMLRRSIVATDAAGVYRLHRTRVELDAEADGDALAYIARTGALTDVVVGGRKDGADQLAAIGAIAAQVQDMAHINALRLRSLKFAYAPERFSREMIARLGELNRLRVAHPLRLEIETLFLRAEEVRSAHHRLVRQFNNRGITVYANTPLLAGVNDTPDAIQALAFALRAAGIEFHHLYVAGFPLQQRHNAAHPVDVADVIDIATAVRREGSGREIPRYIFSTPLGEVDFGLTARLQDAGGSLRLRLLPYDLAYFQQMDAGYRWPEGVTADEAGTPLWTVPGLISSDGFMVD